MGKAISLPRPIHSPAPEDRNREGVWPVPLDPARYLLMSTRRNREAIVTEHSLPAQLRDAPLDSFGAGRRRNDLFSAVLPSQSS